MMNILFVGMYPDEYSPYRNVFFRNLIYEMADQGISCTVISPISVSKYKKNSTKVSKKRIDKTPNGTEVVVYHPRYVSLSSKHFGGLNTGIWTEELFQKCAIKTARKLRQKFDAVYGHFFLSGGLAAIKIANERGIPVFVAYGECNYETEVVRNYREIKAIDIEGLTGIIAVSTNNANVLKSKRVFEGIPLIVAPNSVDAKLFSKKDKTESRKILNLPEDIFIVGFVGGFEERKGDKRLLKAIEQVDGVYGAFAGKGINPPTGEKVIFCQSIDHDTIPVFLNSLDVFCLPTQNEGFCNAIIEAAFCGKPIISSDRPFNDDLLRKENSIRINPDSVEEIRNAIMKLYQDKLLRDCLSKQIQLDAKEFTIESRCKKILTFIRENIENASN